MSNRDSLIAYLEGVLAGTPGLEGVEVVKSARGTDALNKPTLVIQTQGYDKLPAAPIKKRQGRFLATLVSPLRDLDKAEDQLDDLLDILLPALFTSGIIWNTADQGGFDESYLAVEITITSILS